MAGRASHRAPGLASSASYFEYTGAADAGSLGNLSREPSVCPLPCTAWAASSLARVRAQALKRAAPEMLVRGAMAPFDFSWVIGRQEPCAQVSSQARGRFRLDRLLHALLCHWSNCDSRYAQIATNEITDCNNASPCSMPPGRRKRAPCTAPTTTIRVRRPGPRPPRRTAAASSPPPPPFSPSY